MNDENPAPVDELERTAEEAQVTQPAPEPRLPARAPLLATGGRPLSIIPRTFEEAYRIGKAAVVAKWVPYGWRDEMATMAIMHGAEVGLPPMMSLQKIAVINGRPSLWGDAVPAIALATGQLEDWEEGITGEGNEMVAFCRVKRKGIKTPMTVTFSVADAKLAGLWSPDERIRKQVWENKQRVWKDNQPNDSPWHRHPKRMLQMRARRAFRDLFADAFSGLYLAEELIDEPAMRDVTPQAEDHERIANPLGGDDEAEPAKFEFAGATKTVYYDAETGKVVDPHAPPRTVVTPTEPVQAPKAPAATKPPAARKNAQAASESAGRGKQMSPAAAAVAHASGRNPPEAEIVDGPTPPPHPDTVQAPPPAAVARWTGENYLAHLRQWTRLAIERAKTDPEFRAETYLADRWKKEMALRNSLGVVATEEQRAEAQKVRNEAVDAVKALRG